ncbi:MAG: RNA 2',3'-cyclic phosphodiesterase, partial [Pseudomonadota bacterium]
MSGGEKAVRSFVAVPLPAAVQQAVFGVAAELAPALPGVRWSRKVENLHVTVKFLGDVDPAKLAAFGADLQAALATLPTFDITVRGMGAFPSARRANVIWAGIDDPTRSLQKAAALVEAAAASVGVGERETRPFRGHVTVGRAKAAVDAGPPLSRLGARAFGVATVDALHVYESQLGGG